MKISRHVAMGATLFRREALNQINFRWADRRCECQCCCDDMRQLLWGIGYFIPAGAHHLIEDSCAQESSSIKQRCDTATAAGVVLAAFDRRDLLRFRDQFLRSLRASGNNEVVMPVAVGLKASECERLSMVPRLRPVLQRHNGEHVARRRIHDFAEVAESLPAATPAAYWDAGDVIFQASLQPLWDLVKAHPGKLLVVREPCSHPENAAALDWTKTIADPAARHAAQDIVFQHPFLNSGFLAGEAATLAKYFRTVASWYTSPKLAGTLDWGDQMALNLYCHSNPGDWQEVPESWNYCLFGRSRDTWYRDDKQQYVDARGLPIYVVHGNAGTLASRWFRHSSF